MCSKPLITIRSRDLHANDIKGDVGEIISYHNLGLDLSLLLVPMGCSSFGLYLAFPFCLPCDGSSHRSFIQLFMPYM
jgi:hypothetical protein